MTLHTVAPAGWGMPPVTAAVSTRPLDAVLEANVHHSGEHAPAQHDFCAGMVRAFDRYHRDGNGWACLGYHRVICGHGYVYLGRPLQVVPAAAKDHNTPIVAYCLMADDQPATPAQWRALLAMAARDAAAVGRPLQLTTHREVWPYTACPGDPIQRQIAAQRKAHGRRVRAAGDAPDRREDDIMAALPHLRPGDRGQAVKNLQALLTAHGARLEADGIFGPRTRQAVETLQKRERLNVDGRAGVAEWRTLLLP